MNKIKNIFSCLFSFVIIYIIIKGIYHSSYNPQGGVVEINSVQSEMTSLSIEEITKKMSRQDRLNDEDFLIMEKYLMYAKDETFAEEVGYDMFNYLKKNEQHNEQFLNYLKKGGRSRGDSIVQRMLQIMWIEIGEEYEEFDKFAHDFPLFLKNGVAKDSFNKLLDNL